MARSIDFNPRARIRQRQGEYEQQRTVGMDAQTTYESLYPQYSSAFQAAVAYQDVVQAAYDTFQANRTQANLDAYDATRAQYAQLQATYQGYEPQLQQLQATMQSASSRIQEIEGELPGLQQSLAIDMEQQKRQVLERRGGSILTRGFRRAGSAR